MIGAIIGDVVGSIYEFNNIKTKDFPLFQESCRFTDDTVMTCAIAHAILNTNEYRESLFKENMIKAMQQFGKKHINAGYGGRFIEWIQSDHPQPYQSWGNGSAMRVSSIPWIFNSLQQVRTLAKWSAEVTHDHEEGIKGAEAVASAIYMARTSETRDDIKKYIMEEFGYDLNRKVDDIRKNYSFDVSCQGSVPEAIICFLEAKDFEDAIRNAISIGGDSDTIGAITGSIAAAYFDYNLELEVQALSKLTPDLLSVVDRFNARIQHPNPFFSFNQPIVRAIHEFNASKNQQKLIAMLENFRYNYEHNGRLLVSMIQEKKGNQVTFRYQTIKANNQDLYFATFSDPTQLDKQKDKALISVPTKQFMNMISKETKIKGFIFNPWKEKVVMTSEMVNEIIRVSNMHKEKVN